MRLFAFTMVAMSVTSLSLVTITAAQTIKSSPSTGHSLGSVVGGSFGKAQPVIEKRCISCHNERIIEEAIAAGKNMQQIQQRMEQKGAKLTADERRVLGVFWPETPLKKRP